jgi:hypothetical protein
MGATSANYGASILFDSRGGQAPITYLVKTSGTTSSTYAGQVGGNGNWQFGTGTNVNPAVGAIFNYTDAIKLPLGTFAQRPTGAQGYLRGNSDSTYPEYHTGSAWKGLLFTDLSNITSVGVTKGGTGLTATTVGGLLLGTSTTAFTNLTIGTSGYVLTSNGTTASWQPPGATAEGSYSPTITAVANITGSPTATTCYYSAVGNTITVWGSITFDPTTTLTLTQVAISLPSAFNYAGTQTYEMTGFAATVTLNETMVINYDVGNTRALLQCTPVDVANRTAPFKFTYRYVAP